MEKLYEAVEVLKQKREGKSFSFFSLVKNLLSSFKTTSTAATMAYNFHFNVSRQLLDQVPAASFFFLNLQKKLLDQNFSYAALLDEKEAKGNSLVPKLDTLLSLFSFPSSNIDEKSATFSLEGKNQLTNFISLNLVPTYLSTSLVFSLYKPTLMQSIHNYFLHFAQCFLSFKVWWKLKRFTILKHL